MVYSNKFVVCVLVNGCPQKELANGTVSLPFGTEYGLRLRNKHARRAVAKIFIDGENVSGGGYVVDAHDYIDIKRHSDIDRAFKFVSLDSEDAVDFGKNGPNYDKIKGTIEVRFYMERERQQVIYREIVHDHHHHHHHDYYSRPRPIPMPINPYDSPYNGTWVSNRGDTQVDYSCSAEPLRAKSAGSCQSAAKPRGFMSSTASNSPAPDLSALQDGCTVEGHSTGQSFHTTHVELETEATVVKIFLQGFDDRQPQCCEQVRPTVKDRQRDDLERENEELRRKLAELENQQLKEKLEGLEK